MARVNSRSSKGDLVAEAIERGVPSYEAWATPKDELLRQLAGEEPAGEGRTVEEPGAEEFTTSDDEAEG